jgi:hypothetical protein
MSFTRMTIRTRLVRGARPREGHESVVVSQVGGAWRTIEEFQVWAQRRYAGSCDLLENGVTFIEHLGRGMCCVYEITLN